jgi:hypothetical protein
MRPVEGARVVAVADRPVRRGERHDLAHAPGTALGDLARIDAAQAPADQADLALVAGVDLAHPFHQRGQPVVEPAVRARVHAEFPVVHVVAAGLQVGAQGRGGHGAGAEAGIDDDGMPVAGHDGGLVPPDGAELEHRPERFGGQQGQRRGAEAEGRRHAFSVRLADERSRGNRNDGGVGRWHIRAVAKRKESA